MKKGFSVIWVIIGVLIVALLGIATYFVIDGNSKSTDFSQYDYFSIIEGTKDNGNIADHVKGDPDAPVVIFEYADYQCPGCASINPRVNRAIEQLDGKLAVVYRNYLLKYHLNGTAAASAAEAAGLQGYWREYADILFANQSEWEDADTSERTKLFNKYFEEASNGDGDLEKFNKDIASEAVSKKISFDMGIGKRIDLPGTPSFYIDGQLINWGDKGSVTVNGQTISWDSARSGDDFIRLIKDIVSAKIGE